MILKHPHKQFAGTIINYFLQMSRLSYVNRAMSFDNFPMLKYFPSVKFTFKLDAGARL